MSYEINSVEQQKYLLRDSINERLNQHNWTLKMLSDRSSVPYETIKKLANAKIDKPSLYSITRIADAFQCSLDELTGRSSFSDAALPSAHFLLMLESFSAFQQEFFCSLLHPRDGMLPVLHPACHEIDGMPYEESQITYENMTVFQNRYENSLLFGLSVPNSSLEPFCSAGTLLLIGSKPSKKNPAVGVYLRSGHLYLKSPRPGFPYRLDAVTKKGAPILIGTPSHWQPFGFVVDQIRPA